MTQEMNIEALAGTERNARFADFSLWFMFSTRSTSGIVEVDSELKYSRRCGGLVRYLRLYREIAARVPLLSKECR